uniref:Uncharacterized protein n=1 Tax=Anguilla anguilla TaxID=7936 RepID=A0A0E9TDW9_ANGAN
MLWLTVHSISHLRSRISRRHVRARSDAL